MSRRAVAVRGVVLRRGAAGVDASGAGVSTPGVPAAGASTGGRLGRGHGRNLRELRRRRLGGDGFGLGCLGGIHHHRRLIAGLVRPGDICGEITLGLCGGLGRRATGHHGHLAGAERARGRGGLAVLGLGERGRLDEAAVGVHDQGPAHLAVDDHRGHGLAGRGRQQADRLDDAAAQPLLGRREDLVDLTGDVDLRHGARGVVHGRFEGGGSHGGLSVAF
ncbi:hypothetical protein [Microbacterium lacticum]